MFDLTTLLQTGGLLVLFLIIFAESGMMVGFLFPGDTLLFSAGILAATGKLSLATVLVVIAAAAILGDNIGYLIGKYLGPRLFNKAGVVFRKDHIKKAHEFFDKYGAKTMLVAHFVPIVRTFAPVTAGAARMNHRLFIIFDAIGDIAWTLLVTLVGYYLGSRVPGVEKYIEPLLIGIILLFLLPTIFHALRDPKTRRAITRVFKKKPRQDD